MCSTPAMSKTKRSSRLHRRERIETLNRIPTKTQRCVPPGFIAGSGLKHRDADARRTTGEVPPGFIAGSGLKPIHPVYQEREFAVPPGFIAGSGLKPVSRMPARERHPFLPASSPGAD